MGELPYGTWINATLTTAELTWSSMTNTVTSSSMMGDSMGPIGEHAKDQDLVTVILPLVD